jgi:hypothetical protein
MIQIESKKTYRGEGIYVGRKMPDLPGSVLGVQRQLHFHRRQLEFPFHSIKLSASPRVAF